MLWTVVPVVFLMLGLVHGMATLYAVGGEGVLVLGGADGGQGGGGVGHGITGGAHLTGACCGASTGGATLGAGHDGAGLGAAVGGCGNVVGAEFGAGAGVGAACTASCHTDLGMGVGALTGGDRRGGAGAVCSGLVGDAGAARLGRDGAHVLAALNGSGDLDGRCALRAPVPANPAAAMFGAGLDGAVLGVIRASSVGGLAGGGDLGGMGALADGGSVRHGWAGRGAALSWGGSSNGVWACQGLGVGGVTVGLVDGGAGLGMLVGGTSGVARRVLVLTGALADGGSLTHAGWSTSAHISGCSDVGDLGGLDSVLGEAALRSHGGVAVDGSGLGGLGDCGVLLTGGHGLSVGGGVGRGDCVGVAGHGAMGAHADCGHHGGLAGFGTSGLASHATFAAPGAHLAVLDHAVACRIVGVDAGAVGVGCGEAWCSMTSGVGGMG
jgi:hypothetical protein